MTCVLIPGVGGADLHKSCMNVLVTAVPAVFVHAGL